MPIFQDDDFTLVSRADNTKHGRFNLTTVGATNERVLTWPNFTGTIVTLEDNNQVWTAVQTFTSGTTTKDQLFVQGTGTGALGLTAAGTAGKTTSLVALPPRNSTIYLPFDDGQLANVVARAGGGTTVDFTGQTASIGASTIYTTDHAGFYRISAYAVFSAVTVPGALTISAIFTDPVQAQTVPFANAIAYAAVGNIVQGVYGFQATTGSLIRFSTTLTGTGTYNIYVRCESLT